MSLRPRGKYGNHATATIVTSNVGRDTIVYAPTKPDYYPGKPLAQAAHFVDFPVAQLSAPKVRPWDLHDAPDRHLAAISPQSFPAVLMRPQSLSTAASDTRRSPSPSERQAREEAIRPITSRAEAWGGMTASEWKFTNRGDGPTGFSGPGGVLYMPPEVNMSDAAAATPFTPLPRSRSTTYVAVAPGAYFGAGLPDTVSGGMKTAYRWGSDGAGKLTFQKINSSGVASDVLSLDSTGVATFGGVIDAGTHLIHNVVDPAAAQDADTKAARDAAIAVETARATAAEVALAAADALALAKSANLSDVANPGTSRTNLGVGTGDSPQFAGVNVGHASDTTITRTGAGDIAVEGKGLYRVDGADVSVADGGTGASDAANARTNLGLGSVATLTADPDTTLAANTDNNVATQKATKAYVDAAVATAGAPTGTIIMFGSVTGPSGYLSCDGTSYLRATYAALFAVIGTTFGAVDGTHFNVPNFDNAFPQGEGSSNTIGGTGGAVSPTVTDPGHSHVVAQASDMRNGGATTYDNASPTNAATTGISIADGRPPFLSVAFFIKT